MLGDIELRIFAPINKNEIFPLELCINNSICDNHTDLVFTSITQQWLLCKSTVSEANKFYIEFCAISLSCNRVLEFDCEPICGLIKSQFMIER